LVLPFVGTKGSEEQHKHCAMVLIIRYFCLTKVTKNNPDDENLLRSPSEIGKRATARFCPPSGRVSLFHCAYPNVLPTPA
ncbi:MAG: hypothetical protein IJ377_00140, partial [Rikenellaceae bacterium]|nr:hypothetical protein [Rikenellaceae bacterium]